MWSLADRRPLRSLNVDCTGFNVCLAMGDTLWAGAHNGSIFTWDLQTHNFIKELRCHDDAVRSLCRMGSTRMLSGSGSGDG